MKTLTLVITFFLTSVCSGVELEALDHKVVGDNRTFVREESDRRYSVWTADSAMALKILKEFEISADGFSLGKGQILAIFLNDNITEDLTAVVYNRTANKTFGDYADSGIMFKLKAIEEGKKYSHVTAVVFTPEGTPGHLGIRSAVRGGLSEKR